MLCNENLSQSISYIEKQLNKNNAKRFEKHLKKCEKCKRQFDIIALNYDSTLNGDTIPNLKADIINGINHYKYLRDNSRLLTRKWAVAAAVLVLVLGVSANAKSIYKSLEEVLKSMKPTNEYMEHMKRAAGETGSDTVIPKPNSSYKECDSMFSKVEREVFEKGNQMLPGEFVEKLYPELHEGFYVKLYKLSNGKLSIAYGIKNGVKLGIGEHDSIFIVGSNSNENMIQQTIDNRNFIAVPDYLPGNYSFKNIVTSDGRVQRICFSDKNDNDISISYETYIDYSLEEFKTSLVIINEKQAIYHETEAGRRVLHLYIGDNMDKKIISLSTQSISKEELFNIANSLVFHNVENNLLNKENYFKEIKDERLVRIFDEVINREKAGDKMFEIYVSGEKGDKEIVKLSKNDAGPDGWCMVNYMGFSSYEDVKQNMNYPLIFDKESLDKYKLEGATVFFRPFNEVKRVNYVLSPDSGNIYQSAFVEARGLPIEYMRYTVLDYLMMRYISTDDTKIISDSKGQYYAVRLLKDEIIIETIKEIEGRYVSYTINLPIELYADLEYEDIINNLDIIE